MQASKKAKVEKTEVQKYLDEELCEWVSHADRAMLERIIEQIDDEEGKAVEICAWGSGPEEWHGISFTLNVRELEKICDFRVEGSDLDDDLYCPPITWIIRRFGLQKPMCLPYVLKYISNDCIKDKMMGFTREDEIPKTSVKDRLLKEEEPWKIIASYLKLFYAEGPSYE